MQTFPKGISTMWNAYSFIQDLNSYYDNHYTMSASIFVWDLTYLTDFPPNQCMTQGRFVVEIHVQI